MIVPLLKDIGYFDLLYSFPCKSQYAFAHGLLSMGNNKREDTQ